MNTNLLKVVKQIIAENGEEVLADARRLKAFFGDLAKDEPKPLRVAFGCCIEEGAYTALKKAADAADRAGRKAAIAQRVRDEHGLDPALCAEALNILEAALFGTAATARQPPPLVQPEPPHVPASPSVPVTAKGKHTQRNMLMMTVVLHGIAAVVLHGLVISQQYRQYHAIEEKLAAAEEEREKAEKAAYRANLVAAVQSAVNGEGTNTTERATGHNPFIGKINTPEDAKNYFNATLTASQIDAFNNIIVRMEPEAGGELANRLAHAIPLADLAGISIDTALKHQELYQSALFPHAKAHDNLGETIKKSWELNNITRQIAEISERQRTEYANPYQLSEFEGLAGAEGGGLNLYSDWEANRERLKIDDLTQLAELQALTMTYADLNPANDFYKRAGIVAGLISLFGDCYIVSTVVSFIHPLLGVVANHAMSLRIYQGLAYRDMIDKEHKL